MKLFKYLFNKIHKNIILMIYLNIYLVKRLFMIMNKMVIFLFMFHLNLQTRKVLNNVFLLIHKTHNLILLKNYLMKKYKIYKPIVF